MGNLFVVATPIGNLEDVTFRAVKTLQEADLIACEDTRQTKILLDRYQINRPTISYHQHSRLEKIDYLIKQLQSGKNIALVSDAGTPGLNDPGGVLVAKAIENGIGVVSIPGPSAIAAALSISGFPAQSFLFLGFLPKKKGRQTLLKRLAISDQRITNLIVLYESPYRIVKTLMDLSSVFGLGSSIVVARELTKKFEEVIRGNISKVIKHFQTTKPKGEFIIVIRIN